MVPPWPPLPGKVWRRGRGARAPRCLIRVAGGREEGGSTAAPPRRGAHHAPPLAPTQVRPVPPDTAPLKPKVSHRNFPGARRELEKEETTRAARGPPTEQSGSARTLV